ncbi:UNVERIFIED_CONTAM: Homeobox-leucine zipper protein ROC2 [Sesamum calycinum]|uniref:Homeobox-leucine zipper protein ROC2 n=1 Tax=Sesamum calycinum TaxID=2727403 RepID=A0AAW2Q380_9LAMI
MLPDMNSTASGGDESKRKRSDGINNKSSSEDLDNNSINNQELKRKRHHRHTLEQIQEMEAEALSNACCRACGRAIAVVGMSFNEHFLKVENAQLREQIEYLAAILAKFVGKPLVDDAITPSSTASPTIDTEVARKLKGKQKMEE